MARREAPLRWGAAVLGATAAGVLVGGWPGLATGVVLVVPLARLLGRVRGPAARRDQLRAAADLPYLVDLLAAALRAGLPLDGAVRVVATADAGPVAERLSKVARSLELGLPPAQAWTPMSDLPGGPRVVAAVSRSAESGAALAGAFGRLAEQLRSGRMAAVDAAARRAGVLVVLPLGLCFLPAFVFAGVVPVIVAVLGDVLG